MTTPFDRARETGRLARLDQPEEITHAGTYAAQQHRAAAERHDSAAREISPRQTAFNLRHRMAAAALRISATQEA